MLTVSKKSFGCCECDGHHSVKYVLLSGDTKFYISTNRGDSDCKSHAQRLTPEETSISQARPALGSVSENSVFEDTSDEDDTAAYKGIIVRDFAADHYPNINGIFTNTAPTASGTRDEDESAIYSDSEDEKDTEGNGQDRLGSTGQKTEFNKSDKGNKTNLDAKDDKKNDHDDTDFGGDGPFDAPDEYQSDDKIVERDVAKEDSGGDDDKTAVASIDETGQQAAPDGPPYVDPFPDMILEWQTIERHSDPTTGLVERTVIVPVPHSEPMMFKMDEDYEEEAREKEALEREAREEETREREARAAKRRQKYQQN